MKLSRFKRSVLAGLVASSVIGMTAAGQAVADTPDASLADQPHRPVLQHPGDDDQWRINTVSDDQWSHAPALPLPDHPDYDDQWRAGTAGDDQWSHPLVLLPLGCGVREHEQLFNGCEQREH